MGFPGGTSGKAFSCLCRRCRFDPWVRKIPWSRKWQPTPVFLPGKLLAVHGTLKSLLQHHSTKASILQCSAFFYSPTLTFIHNYWKKKHIALSRQTFVGKVMSLLFNMLSRLVITFLPRSKLLLISWL